MFLEREKIKHHICEISTVSLYSITNYQYHIKPFSPCTLCINNQLKQQHKQNNHVHQKVLSHCIKNALENDSMAAADVAGSFLSDSHWIAQGKVNRLQFAGPATCRPSYPFLPVIMIGILLLRYEQEVYGETPIGILCQRIH